MAIGRAFVAVVPPDDVLDALEARIAAVRADWPELRWVRREQLHVTLQFLGRVPDVEALVTAVGEAVGRVPSFEVRLGGVGAFPKPRRASVVWTGVRDGVGELSALARAVHDATSTLGFASEERPFHPHVTLARAPRPMPVDVPLTALGDAPVGPAFTGDSVVLFESRTRQEGAVYPEHARLPLSVQ